MDRVRCALLAVCAVLVSGQGASAADAPAVVFGGQIEHPRGFSLVELKALPSTQVAATFGTMHGQEHHVWTGVKLLDLIEKTGLKAEPVKNAALRHSALVQGRDGYAVAVALGEMEPMAANKPIILAYRSDAGPADLPGLRLVVPGDQNGARQVHDVVEVDIK